MYSKLAELKSKTKAKQAYDKGKALFIPAQVSCNELRYSGDRKEKTLNSAKIGLKTLPGFVAGLGYMAYESGALFNNPIYGGVAAICATTLVCGASVAVDTITKATKNYQEIISTPEKTVPMRDALKLLCKDLFSGKVNG